MSKVTNCAIQRVAGQLNFDFRGGGCNTFSFGIMLCFPNVMTSNYGQKCFS